MEHYKTALHNLTTLQEQLIHTIIEQEHLERKTDNNFTLIHPKIPQHKHMSQSDALQALMHLLHDIQIHFHSHTTINTHLQSHTKQSQTHIKKILILQKNCHNFTLSTRTRPQIGTHTCVHTVTDK
jgi:hypothetical protein